MSRSTKNVLTVVITVATLIAFRRPLFALMGR